MQLFVGAPLIVLIHWPASSLRGTALFAPAPPG